MLQDPWLFRSVTFIRASLSRYLRWRELNRKALHFIRRAFGLSLGGRHVHLHHCVRRWSTVYRSFRMRFPLSARTIGPPQSEEIPFPKNDRGLTTVLLDRWATSANINFDEASNLTFKKVTYGWSFWPGNFSSLWRLFRRETVRWDIFKIYFSTIISQRCQIICTNFYRYLHERWFKTVEIIAVYFFHPCVWLMREQKIKKKNSAILES